MVQIKGKLNAITLDNCAKCGLVFETVVASCEVVNSRSVQACIYFSTCVISRKYQFVRTLG